MKMKRRKLVPLDDRSLFCFKINIFPLLLVLLNNVEVTFDYSLINHWWLVNVIINKNKARISYQFKKFKNWEGNNF